MKNITKDSIEDIEIAKLFHDTYERLASGFGYETRKDTKKFDPFSNNGRLMVETCRLVVKQIRMNDIDMVEGLDTYLYNNVPVVIKSKVLSIIKQENE